MCRVFPQLRIYITPTEYRQEKNLWKGFNPKLKTLKAQYTAVEDRTADYPMTRPRSEAWFAKLCSHISEMVQHWQILINSLKFRMTV